MAMIKVPRLLRAARVAPISRASGGEGLDAFATERGPDARQGPEGPFLPTRGRMPWGIVGIALVGVLAAAAPRVAASDWWSVEWGRRLFAPTAKPASLTVRTVPAGARVEVDGEWKGETPLSLSLPAGAHRLRLTATAGQERTFELTLEEGQSLIQEIEWAASPSPVLATGALDIQTDPPGQAVFLDEVRRGTSPIILADLAPGEHRLVVTGQAGTFRRNVTVTAGEVMSVVVAPATPVVSAGWLRVVSPVVLQLRSNGDLVGNSDTDRVMLPAGDHEVEMSNELLGFSRRQRVTVSAGRTAEVRVSVPNGLLSINAIPWAEVWVGGERLGQTPLANIAHPIGVHRVTFRHPELGEREAPVTIPVRETARLGVDMRRGQQP